MTNVIRIRLTSRNSLYNALGKEVSKFCKVIFKDLPTDPLKQASNGRFSGYYYLARLFLPCKAKVKQKNEKMLRGRKRTNQENA